MLKCLLHIVGVLRRKPSRRELAELGDILLKGTSFSYQVNLCYYNKSFKVFDTQHDIDSSIGFKNNVLTVEECLQIMQTG